MAKRVTSPRPPAPSKRAAATAKPVSPPRPPAPAPRPPEPPVPAPMPVPPPAPIEAPAASSPVLGAVPDAFPKWRYHASGDRTIVASQAAQDALGPGWSDTPPASQNGSTHD